MAPVQRRQLQTISPSATCSMVGSNRGAETPARWARASPTVIAPFPCAANSGQMFASGMSRDAIAPCSKKGADKQRGDALGGREDWCGRLVRPERTRGAVGDTCLDLDDRLTVEVDSAAPDRPSSATVALKASTTAPNPSATYPGEIRDCPDEALAIYWNLTLLVGIVSRYGFAPFYARDPW